MRRRTKRVRIRPGPIIVLTLGINLIAGIVSSPITSVRRVRVEGAPPQDRPRLVGLLQKLKGVPCVRVHAHAIEAEALQNPELRGATLSRTPFGSAVLRVARRMPVAKLYASPDTGFSEEGVLYPATDLPDDLPRLNFTRGEPPLGLTLGNGWRAADVAHLAILVRGMGGKVPVRIDLVGGGRVCLNIDSGTVDLGSCDGLDAKVARLRKILQERPDLFSTVQTLRLVRIDDPGYIPRPGPLRP